MVREIPGLAAQADASKPGRGGRSGSKLSAIPTSKRLDVASLYFEGLSYDKIVRETGVAKGSVVNIIRELKERKMPQFADLAEEVQSFRELAVRMRKAHLGVIEAAPGLSFYSRLEKLGVEPHLLDDWIKLCRTMIASPDYSAEKLVGRSAELVLLEGRLGMSAEDVLDSLEAKHSELLDIESKVQELEKKKARLDMEIAEENDRVGRLRSDEDFESSQRSDWIN